MARSQRLVARLAAAVLVTAAATLAAVAGPGAPAQAAYCSGGAGVSVLVDFGALGGGTVTGCGSGATAAAAFGSAGFTLQQHPRQQGFVCRVQGKPANGDCLATDAYWGFFVADDGKGWVYASQGVYQQAVDARDSVALVWQSSAARRAPGPAPAVGASAAPAPTKAASPRPARTPRPKASKHVDRPADPATTGPTGSGPSAGPTAGSTAGPTAGSTSASTRPSAAGSRPADAASSGAPRSRTTSPGAPSATPSATVRPSAAAPGSGGDPADAGVAATRPVASADDGGLPGWVPPAVVVLLAAAAGGVALVRRAR